MLGWERPDLFYMLPCQFNVQVFVDIDKSEVTQQIFYLLVILILFSLSYRSRIKKGICLIISNLRCKCNIYHCYHYNFILNAFSMLLMKSHLLNNYLNFAQESIYAVWLQLNLFFLRNLKILINNNHLITLSLKTQPITIGQNFSNNPYPIATMVTW